MLHELADVHPTEAGAIATRVSPLLPGQQVGRVQARAMPQRRPGGRRFMLEVGLGASRANCAS